MAVRLAAVGWRDAREWVEQDPSSFACMFESSRVNRSVWSPCPGSKRGLRPDTACRVDALDSSADGADGGELRDGDGVTVCTPLTRVTARYESVTSFRFRDAIHE